MTKGPRRRRRRRRPDLPRRSFKRAAADGQDGIHRTESLRCYAKSLRAASSALSLAQVGNVVPITFCPLAPRSVPLTIGRRGAEKCSPPFLSLSPLSLSLPTFFAA